MCVCVCVRACVRACVCVNLYVLYIELCTWFSPQHALQCSPNTWMTMFAQFPGVLDEREYWKTRLTTLTSIREQLSSLLALTILSHLEEAHSSYSGAFGQVYKDVDKVLSLCIYTLSSCIHTLSSCIHTLFSCIHTLFSCIHTLSSCIHTLSSCIHTLSSCTTLFSCIRTV